jgi:hypothetical protein
LLEDLRNIDWNITIAVFILGNIITHAYTYVIVVLCVPVAAHGHLPNKWLKILRKDIPAG